MALNAGNTACTTGLSARIYSQWTGDTANSGLVLSGTALNQIKSLCYAIAVSVVAEIQANAAVTTSTPGAAAGASSLPGTGSVT